jgi:hypothetical protein
MYRAGEFMPTWVVHCKEQPMRGGIHAVLLACCLLWPLSGLAELPEGVAGRWSGTVFLGDRERPIEITIKERGGGFSIDLILPDIVPLRADLVATDEPQVFEVAAESGGLFGFFGGGSERGTDPLSGTPLVWARTTTFGLVVYRLAVHPDGDMGLLRAALDVIGDSAELSVERRINVRPPERFQTVLTGSN